MLLHHLLLRTRIKIEIRMEVANVGDH